MATVRATVKDIKSAVRSVVGFVPAELRVAERYIRARTFCSQRANFEKSLNGLNCEAGAETADNEALDAALLKSLDYTRGVLLDLYVYRKTRYDTELETNVSVIIDSSGAVLTAYDNVGHHGYCCDEWWCGREVES